MSKGPILNVLAALALLLACNKQPETISVTGITVNPTSAELTEGESVTITATVAPSDATNKNVQWSSSNPDIQVSNGTVTTSFKPGAATTSVGGRLVLGKGTITATTEDGGKTATCEITVFAKTIAVTSISMSTDELFLEKGQSFKLEATVLPDNASEKTVQWTSSDTSIATVDQNGTVNAIAAGKTTVMASAGGVSASCAVTVVFIPVSSIYLDQNSVTLEIGETVTLTATVSPKEATDKTVRWTSSDESVATVDQSGQVTAVNSGSATIKAVAGDYAASCAVKVIVPVASITLNKTELTLLVGDTAQLEASILPENATDKTTVWDSSNPNVATVDDGRITAVSFGIAVITAQAGYHLDNCVVTVLTDSPEGVTAEYLGGDFSSDNGFLQNGSLSFKVSNMSTESITVKTVQLIDGETGNGADIQSLDCDLTPGLSHEWSIALPAAGINSPTAVFTYTYQGEERTCSAQYRLIQIKSKRR